MVARVGADRGTIPAHAGKTSWRKWRHSGSRDYPRSRGENAKAVIAESVRPGLSPLTRGKLPPRGQAPSAAGTIPAHAGKTPSSARQRSTTGDYPRSRGENERINQQNLMYQGLSPLTRGKRPNQAHKESRLGTIPAHAGKTHRARRPARSRWDYPRSRGENRDFWQKLVSHKGLSPLTRGKP